MYFFNKVGIIFGILTLTVSANESQMLTDYNKFMVDNKVGTTIDWANGKLTRTDSGARYVDQLGMITLLPEKNPNFNEIADQNPNIAKLWSDSYGFSPAKLKVSENGNTNNTRAVNKNNSAAQNDYITALKNSSIDAFLEAYKKYKSGSLSKDKFTEFAISSAQTIEYERNTIGKEKTSLDTYDPNKWLEVNQAVLPKMRDDYAKFLTSTKLGTSITWANGKLVRTNDGALYVAPNGSSVTMPNSQNGAIDFNDLALKVPEIADQWSAQYGFKPVGNKVNLQAGYSSDSFSSNIIGNNNWYPKQYGVNIQNWIQENYNSLNVGQSKTWNDLTIFRAGSPRCLIILSNDGVKKTELCMSDDFDKNIPNNPFASELAKKYWGYQANN